MPAQQVTYQLQDTSGTINATMALTDPQGQTTPPLPVSADQETEINDGALINILKPPGSATARIVKLRFYAHTGEDLDTSTAEPDLTFNFGNTAETGTFGDLRMNVRWFLDEVSFRPILTGAATSAKFYFGVTLANGDTWDPDMHETKGG